MSISKFVYIAANEGSSPQHVPILRYLSREFGAYDGHSSFDKYVVDAVSDLYIDWRVSSFLIYDQPKSNDLWVSMDGC